MNHSHSPVENGMEVAIVGMSCRFPGADHIDTFWKNLKNGVESVSLFSDEELQEAGIDQETLQHPNYKKAGGAIFGTEWFDLNVFQYSPKEAEVMDPQLKILHECAWEALEHSGYCPDTVKGLIGTYIGCSTNLYWLDTVYRHATGFLKEAELLNGSQFFSTRLSHKLNLKGPSYTVQTACSSSLVAVHLACQALLSGDCDMALAGGVSITLPEKRGYFYQEGMILSQDGKCRPFDASARGTVNGNGAGIVVLKRLEDAIASGDFIHAIVKGSAINNDGANKVSFTAPSVEGQADVIRTAHHISEVEPESISYVEAHGTGTILGDPIEVEALKLAFNTEKQGFCGIGSVKANIGHLDNAAGVAGFIKTAIALKNRMIPPSINYEKPNPKINFENSPFYVNKELTKWNNRGYPLRAGVSSFGMGGTNAHVILEEAPERGSSDQGRKFQLLSFSAQTEKSLEDQTKKLAGYLNQEDNVKLADLSYTLLTGRKNLKYRRMLVVSTKEEAKRELLSLDPAKVQTVMDDGSNKQMILMFPGQGTQYVNMGLELFREEKVFRDEMNRCFHLLEEISGLNWQEVIYPSEINGKIDQTLYTQPSLFAFEYSLAKMLMEYGIRPDGMIGHSIGEYTAACLAGVFSLKDALKLVYERGKLMQQLPKGSMVSVMASGQEIMPFLSEKLSIAAVNGPFACVVSGPNEEIILFEEQLASKGMSYKKLATSHAFHSSMMEPILEAYKERLREIDFHPPSIPYLSNVTGEWITASEATSPDYWVHHLRHTVRFSDGISQLLTGGDYLFVEVGPGRALSTLVRQQSRGKLSTSIVNTVRHPKEEVSDEQYLLQTIGKLHMQGVKIDWSSYFANEKRHRIPLPTYSFDRKLYRLHQNAEHDVPEAPYIEEHPAESKQASSSPDGKEQKIIEAFKDVTGVYPISRQDDFFEIGGSSLTAVNVVARLQKDFDISINHLFQYPRVSDLAKHMTDKKASHRVDKAALAKYLTARRKSHRLVEDETMQELRHVYENKNNRYVEADLSRERNYKEILLTGATGYLGAYLLYELLTKFNSFIHLIVRGDNQAAAEKRLKEKICSYFGPSFYDEYKQKIVVYNGDLTKKELGLDRITYQYLSETIECIIHSAGNVSHFGNEAESYKANVVSTQHMVDFALSGSRKDFNHISTLAVASGVVLNKRDILFTEYDDDLGQTIEHPYPKTKLQAEKLVMEARNKGIKANIFRVGNIVFDSSSGRFQENIEQNSLYTMMKSYLRIGLVPEMDRDTDFSCVDDVSRAIINLFAKEALINETYHIFNPNYVSLADILTTPGLTIDVKEVSIEAFIDYIFDEKQSERFASDLYALQLHSVGEDLTLTEESIQTIFHILADKTNQLLGRTGFVWNDLNERMIKKMIEHGQNVDFFSKTK
ncbi:beta-ketoacyl synthase N-terminal-like domain-containing protein [Metabacillus sp. Hm71]|uniref:beta-ketoacyl synthase N-terminal-like domain-containing protein n=1 Tax=Metabacillus sp. Hm71 TaxID=3450743 RepID=UPI003F444DDC